eukprot:TRINITY_DN6754_c0_g1_i1.p1 TRINITY_DN6754_c0_g1~~TRINITY_DN6754_c0_g1_i1.p1  ORF type:complete len:554 (+),score=124.76 TRINITY_DN6754_c0_g1_i1:80-1741(+)
MGCGTSSDGGMPGAEAEGATGLLTPGTRVKTQFTKEEGGDDLFYDGVIKKVTPSGDVTIKYDDGDVWTGNPVWVYRLQPEPDQIRAPRLHEKVKALLRDVSERPNPEVYSQEFMTFNKKIGQKIVHVAENYDFSGRYEMFEGCGDMEKVGNLLQQLEEAQSGRGFDMKTQRRASTWFDSAKVIAADPELLHLCNAVAASRLQWALQQNAAPPLRYALLNAKQLYSQNLDIVPKCLEAFGRLNELPKEWQLQCLLEAEFGYRLLSKSPIQPSSEVFKSLQRIMDDSFVDRFTRDRSRLDEEKKVPKRLVLVKADQVQNVPNWLGYQEMRNRIAGKRSSGCQPIEGVKTMKSQGIKKLPGLNDSVNEYWLWHGTKADSAQAITTGDFNLKFVGSRAGTLYGAGVYLAEACTKSDEYTAADSEGLRPLLLCRATCGHMNVTVEERPDVNALHNSVSSGKFESVLGDREQARGTYREFIVYDEDQVYPAYICWYKRDFVNDPPPPGAEPNDTNAPNFAGDTNAGPPREGDDGPQPPREGDDGPQPPREGDEPQPPRE